MPAPTPSPTTTMTCPSCKIGKLLSAFYLTRNLTPNGWCKECEKAARRQRYADTNGAVDREWRNRNQGAVNETARRSRARRKIEVLHKYGEACTDCGIDDAEVLAIDHINDDGAAHRRITGMGSSSAFYAWLKKNEWPEGFQTLCLNCNHKKYLRSLRTKRGE